MNAKFYIKSLEIKIINNQIKKERNKPVHQLELLQELKQLYYIIRCLFA